MLPDFIESDVDLAARNTLALPARAARFASIRAPEQLLAIARHPELSRLPRLVLGGGSNLVLSGDFPGLVLAIELAGKTRLGEDAQAHYVAAAAGENWHAFVCWCLEQGLPGLENLALIPGRVGAAPIQNIGAYGVEVADFIDHLEVFDFSSGKTLRLSGADCGFAYRDSLFKREGWHRSGRCVITRVCFRLPKPWRPRTAYGEIAAELARRGISAPTPLQMAETVIAIRRKKLPDPARLPNVGSFFQNPIVSAEFAQALAGSHPELPRYPQADGRVKLAAAWLIERAGWKGRNLGPVGMYEDQALVLVNRGGAQSRDVLALTRAVREAVLARFGVNLLPEPVFI
jgi:UDP-N-acetylmuramate dehydrogenase